MPRPRKECVSLEATSYYHCVSRCVRRAFLCGTDVATGKSYEHRRDWIEQRIVELTQCFAIEVCAYAMMGNHYHIVLKINAEQVKSWSMCEIFMRWTQLFAGSTLINDYLKDLFLNEAQMSVLKEQAEIYRERLMNLSWFMRCLNEPIARQANSEDSCTGHFWESRFKSQALLDEAALLSAMAYVDLNPIRAKMATTPEQSEFTSIKARLDSPEIEQHLLAFCPTQKLHETIQGIPFAFDDYLQLVDWTGRAIRNDKRGYIPNDIPPIFARLNIDAEQWVKQHPHLETNYPTFFGNLKQLENACQQFRRKWIKGRQHAQLLFN